MPELTGRFYPDNGTEVVGYSGKFAGRTFGSRGAQSRGAKRAAGNPDSSGIPAARLVMPG
jgi:hypothetical protein